MVATGSVNGAVMNLTIGALGVSVLTIPNAFVGIGSVPATVLLAGVAVMRVKSMEYLGLSMQTFNSYSFEQVIAKLAEGLPTAMGYVAVTAARMMLFLYNFGDCVGDVLVIGHLCPEVLGYPLLALLGSDVSPFVARGLQSHTCWMALYWLCVLLPLSFVRRVTMLERGAAVSVVVILYIVSAVVFRFVFPLSTGAAEEEVHLDDDVADEVTVFTTPSMTKSLLSLPLVIYAYDCQALVCKVFKSLAEPTPVNMSSVARRTMAVVFSILVCIGLFGYLTFGSTTPDNILRSYSTRTDILFAIAFALFLIPVTIAYSLVLFPVRDVVKGIVREVAARYCTSLAAPEKGAAHKIKKVVVFAMDSEDRRMELTEAEEFLSHSSIHTQEVMSTSIDQSPESDTIFKPIDEGFETSAVGLPSGDVSEIGDAATPQDVGEELNDGHTDDVVIIDEDPFSPITAWRDAFPQESELADWLRSDAFFKVLSFCLSLMICITAMIAPDLDVVFSLLGGLCSSGLCFVYPAAFRLRLHKMGIVAFSGWVERWTAIAMLVLGVCGCCLGTFAGLYAIVAPS